MINYKNIKEFLNYIKKIKPSILSSSITFYLLFMIMPAYSLISSTLSILEVDGYTNKLYFKGSGFIQILTIIFSIIWVSGKVVNVLNKSSSIIHEEKPKKEIGYFLRSYLFVFFIILLIVIEIVVSMFIIYLLENILGITKYYILVFIQFIIELLSITFVSSLIYKYIIPIKIKFYRILYLSFIITIIWYILIVGYKIFIKFFNLTSYFVMYGSVTNLIIFMIVINLIVSVYLYGLIFNYFIEKYMHKKSTTGYNNIGQSEVIK